MLIEKAKDKDQSAFGKLYEETYQAVYYTAKGILHDDDITMDIVQDSYVKAWQRLDQLEDPGRFQAWIKRIAANGAKDYLKKKKENLFSQYEDEEGNVHLDMEDDRLEYQPAAEVDKAETRQLVEEILYGLPDEQRICTMMYYFDEMKIREIAEDLGVSENTVKSRLNYSKKKIKEAVLDLEKKGTKLYGLAPLPFFLWLLRESATEAPVKPFAELWKLVSNLHMETAGKLAAEPASKISAESASTLKATAGKAVASNGARKAACAGVKQVITHTIVHTSLAVKISVIIVAGAVVGGATTAVMVHHAEEKQIETEEKDTEKGKDKPGEGSDTKPKKPGQKNKYGNQWTDEQKRILDQLQGVWFPASDEAALLTGNRFLCIPGEETIDCYPTDTTPVTEVQTADYWKEFEKGEVYSIDNIQRFPKGKYTDDPRLYNESSGYEISIGERIYIVWDDYFSGGETNTLTQLESEHAVWYNRDSRSAEEFKKLIVNR